ncbi:hypothetical protein GLYMA_09G058132v4 [Glycine max]|nr:hypothetical protein GLYMA_09G058132v4 [Glycine max]KAH1041667.1 hypothetical protein GYH30_024162 [Glycine max]
MFFSTLFLTLFFFPVTLCFIHIQVSSGDKEISRLHLFQSNTIFCL